MTKFTTKFTTTFNRIKRRFTRGIIKKYSPLLLIPLIALSIYFTLAIIAVPRAPSLHSGSGDSLYSASNSIYTANIGTRDGGSNIGFSVGDSTASFTLTGSDKVKASKQGKSVTFPSVQPSVDLKYTTTSNGIKEELIIKEYNKNTKNTFLFDLSFTSDVVPKKIVNGFVDPTFHDQTGQYLFHFEKPFAVDASGSRTNDVILQLSEDKQLPGKYSAKLIVDEEWLSDPTRAYPVSIDPTIVHDTTTEFAAGYFDRIKDIGSGSAPFLETYYKELPTDQYTAGLWHMNEASGNVLDSSGNGNTGTPTGTAIVSGLMGNARSFNGTTQYITTPFSSPSSLDIDTNPITIEAWFKTNNVTTAQGIIGRGTVGTDGYGIRVNSTGKINLGSHGGSNFDGLTTLVAGQWYHVAGIINGSDSRIYINGQLDQVGTINIVASTVNNLYIGADWTGVVSTFFDGTIDEVRISNIARSAEQIKADASRRPSSIYTSPTLDLGGSNSWITAWNPLTWTELGVATGDGETLKDATSLVAQWNLNSTSGTTATNDAGSCGASCDGTLTTFASTASQDQAAGTGWTTANRRWGAGALMFDGVDDFVEVSSFTFNQNAAYSTEFWFNPKTSSSTQYLFDFRSADSAGQAATIAYNLTSNRISYAVYGGTFIDSKTPIATNNWHHIVIIHNSNSNLLDIYINGKLDSSSTISQDLTITSSPLRIGARRNTGTVPYLGSLDSTRIYSRALTASEILSNYGAGNVELQTRVGDSSTPDDGTWEEWRSATGETTITSLDSDANNWTWDSSATYFPNIKSDESNIKIEGSGSLKQITGQPQVDANTVALWHMDETGGTGDYIKDSTTNANHGTPASTTLVNGVTSRARSFSGTTGSYISDTSITPTLSANLTVQAWFKTSAAPSVAERFIDLAQTSTVGLQVYMAITGIIGIDNSGGPTSSPATTLTYIDNKWHHIAVTRSGTTYTLYVDGASVGTSGGTAPTYTKLFLGKRSDDYGPWEGSLDEFKVDNIARSAEEIAESYRLGRDHYLNKTISSTDLSDKTSLPFYVAADRPGSYLSTIIGESAFANYQTDANTVGLWHLDEQSGSGAYIKDSSGLGNHSTATGTTSVQGKIGRGRSFNGTSDYINIPDTASLSFGNGSTDTPFSISTWIYPTNLIATNWIINKRDAVTNNEYQVAISSTSISFIIFSSNSNTIYLLKRYTNAFTTNQWYHITTTYDGSKTGAGLKIYVNGALQNTTDESIGTYVATMNGNQPVIIGRQGWSAAGYFYGTIDEMRIDGALRSADDIRQAYEIGLRTHPITIDFGAKLDSGNLITGVSDLGFTVDATYYGLNQKGDSLFPGDKIIVKENYDGTQYLAQGVVTSVVASTGAVTIAAWDSGSTFPAGGYTVSASVFKWQREYWRVDGEVQDSSLDAITNLTLRLTDGSEGRTIYLDDLRSTSGYLSTPAGSTITSSTGMRYMQYRAILSSFDEAVSPQLSTVNLDYVINVPPGIPTLDAPLDTATNISLTPSLETTSTDADSDYLRYKIELCTNALMTLGCQTFDQTISQTGWSGQNAQTSTAYTSGTKATYSIASPLLDPSTTYYYRSYAIDPAGVNTWSSTQSPIYSFTTTTIPTTPSTPYSEGTTDPTGVTDTTPEFSAVHSDPDSDAAVYYEIEVNTDNTFTGTVMWDSGAVSMTSLASGVRSTDVSYGGTSIPLDGLGTIYYWHIRFTDINGALGAWSTTSSFTMNLKPLLPTLISPINAAANQSLTPTLSTSATDSNSDYLRYKIELCTNLAMNVDCQTFDQTISQTGWSGQDAETSTAYTSGTTANYTLQTHIPPRATYYWRSYAIDPAGSNLWSPTQSTPYSFVTRDLFEATECRIDESNDKTAFTLSWKDREVHEDGYEIQRSVNGGSFSLLATGLAIDSYSYTDNSIAYGSIYNYRIAPYISPGTDANTTWCTTSTLLPNTGTFRIN